MARLNKKQKQIIVSSLACFNSVSEVQSVLKEMFDLDLPASQVSFYNPDTRNGRELSEDLRQLYRHTREEYMTEITKHPIANKGFRLGELQKNYDKAKNNIVLRNQILEQAAKEVGGVFEGKGNDGNDGDGTSINNYIQQIYNRIENKR